ncbi:uncharacterized protein [Montipora capricornis]|uniref:uncharacterized protein n=1 Tax=Montipora capricornis TaxID=246305 RepID=UPI0035F203FD
MGTLQNGDNWQRFLAPFLLVCAVLAYGNLDTQGVTRQFISKINHDCRDFKVVLNKCHVWKDMGFCFKYRRQMQHVCNRTCQYCFPGQKQWEVIDRVWGRVRESTYQQESARAKNSRKRQEGPVVQVLGKEIAPQVDDAANAIATQLNEVPPTVLGELKKSVNATLQSNIKEQLPTPQTASTKTKQVEFQGARPTISGKTQPNPQIKKPALPLPKGKQVTVTIDEKPGTGEATVKMESSPKTIGVSYKTDGTQEGLPDPNNFLLHENEEFKDRSYEEEAKIKEAANAVKKVMKLFGNSESRRGRMHDRRVSQVTHDFPADSKSRGLDNQVAGIQSAIDAQSKSQDRAAAKAQALSQQIGRQISNDENAPNYAVISAGDSNDWKSLARVLATQLKQVLNHMEHREMQSRYEQQKIQEEMMLMARQQMMDRHEDDDLFDDNDDDDDDDDDDEMFGLEKRRQFVLTPNRNNTSENATRNYSFNNNQSISSKGLASGKKMNESRLLHRAVQKLLKLEMLEKLRGELKILSS